MDKFNRYEYKNECWHYSSMQDFRHYLIQLLTEEHIQIDKKVYPNKAALEVTITDTPHYWDTIRDPTAEGSAATPNRSEEPAGMMADARATLWGSRAEGWLAKWRRPQNRIISHFTSSICRARWASAAPPSHKKLSPPPRNLIFYAPQRD